MRYFILGTFFALFLSQIACQKGPGGVETENGYRVVNHTNKGGAKAQGGELVKVQVATYVGDSLMQDTRKLGGPRDFMVPTADQMPKGRKVPALYDGLLYMGEGDSATIYQPVDSLIERQLPESLKKEKWVRFEVVLVDIITKEDIEKKNQELEAQFVAVEAKMKDVLGQYTTGKLANVTTTETGLKYMVVEQGTGAPVKEGEQVEVHYYGALRDGKMFDNSFQRGETLGFQAGAGQMIKGFDEGTRKLNHGGKAFFFIPPALGYGDAKAGEIPPNSELIFYVEVQ